MTTQPGKLAIIGAGPSGLVSLKFALDHLPQWQVVCFEKQDGYFGAWGKTHPKFVSTSTKYTTQFACFQRFAAKLRSNQQVPEEFFCADQYGAYLSEFVSVFQLAGHIRLEHRIRSIKPVTEQDRDTEWVVHSEHLPSRKQATETFSHVIIATGLANRVRSSRSDGDVVRSARDLDSITGKTVVVCGGGESAVDLAERLCDEEKQNEVYLSLRSGVRVSPRYHPIRNIPSDFLRTRLMLSIHEDIRNFVGGGFVNFRIRFARMLEMLFPHTDPQDSSPKAVRTRKAKWNLRINARAKGKLFNMFHNKSDDFLKSIAEHRLHVVGPSIDLEKGEYKNFEQTGSVHIQPDVVLNATGFELQLTELTDNTLQLQDFYWGMLHRFHRTVQCVGYARPIIGNIPTIAEMQARYVVGLIAGKHSWPNEIENLHARERIQLAQQYPTIDISKVYPADMIPYCDRLAREMGGYPRRGPFESWRQWLRFWLAPATTHQYDLDASQTPWAPIYTPSLIVALLLLVKLIDVPYRMFRSATRSR